MPNGVPGSIHNDDSVPCPEHALTPTPPPSPPPPPYEITNVAGECFLLVVSEDCQHHGFTNVLDAGECEGFAAAVATGTGTSIAFINRANDDFPSGCNAYTTVTNGILDILTYWNVNSDPNNQGHLGIIVDPDSNSDLVTTNNLVCRCPRPPPPPAPPAPPAPPPPSPRPPPRPPPPRLYAGGGCAFYTDDAASNPGVREKKGTDNGLSVSGSVNQPLIAVGAGGGPSTSSEWLELVTDKGQGDAEENGAGVLFFQVTVDDSGRGTPNSAVTNARCVELCDWWDKCVTYEYFKWDGGRPCGDNSPNGCERADAYMRCELWIYPTDASVYSAVEEHVDDVWCGAAGNGPHSGDQAPQNWPDLDDPTLKPNQPWPPVLLPTIPVPICTKSLDYVLIFEWKADAPYHNYAEGEHKTDFVAFVENWVHHIDHGPELNQARGGVIMMNAPSTADCDFGCDTTVSSDLSTCACIEWVSRFPQTSGAQIMADLAAWVASHDPTSGGHTDIINALDAAASALDDEDGEAIGLSKSIVFALSSYSDTYTETNNKVNEVAARTTRTGEDWNVYFLSVGGVLPSGAGYGGVSSWGDFAKATFTMPGWGADGYSGTSPHHGHEIMQGWAEHSCPASPPVYALVAPDQKCSTTFSSAFSSVSWPGGGSSISCCTDTDNWSGVASGLTFAQLRANCEAACSSGVHGQCNVIQYWHKWADPTCNLGYYNEDVRTTLVDSVLNNECEDSADMSVWVAWPANAYRLVGAETKCDIHTLATWEGSGNNFHPCCAAHDGGPADLQDPLIHKTFTLPSGTVATTLIPYHSCDAAGTHGGPYGCEQAYDEPANHVFDGTQGGDTLYHSATTCDAGDHNWVAFYFAEPQDIAVIEVVNRGSDGGACCGPRLQDHEIYYCTNGATSEAGCDWTLCSTYSGDTTHGQVINHACNAPGATGFKLKQPCHGTDSYLNVHAAKAYAVSAFAYQNFEQLKANCEAACDGWAATSGRGSCNVITYQDRNRCELGHYDGGPEAFEQRIGDCSSNARYDTYVRNTPLERLVPTACFIDNEHQDYPCTGCIDGETEEQIPYDLFGCGTGGNDGGPHLVDVYFPAADISRVVVHNRKAAECHGTHCSYRLGDEGWEVWYLPTSKGEGAYVEGNYPNGDPYVAHWVKCFETDVPTLNELVLEVDCVASNVFGVRIVQKYWDSMNLNEVEVYGTALPQPDNCVLSGAADPVTGHLCSPAPSGAGSTADAFCRDTGHGGCPGAWCIGSGSGRCGQ